MLVVNPVWICLGLATRKHLNLHLDSSKDLFAKDKGMLYIYNCYIYIYTHIVLICCIFIITYNIYFCRRHATHPPSRHLTFFVDAGRRSFWSTRSGALAAAVGFVAATWLAEPWFRREWVLMEAS